MKPELERLLAKLLEHHDARELGKFRATYARILALCLDPGFEHFAELTGQFLTHYPESVFTGVSGDSGAVFVAGLRKLHAELEARHEA